MALGATTTSGSASSPAAAGRGDAHHARATVARAQRRASRTTIGSEQAPPTHPMEAFLPA